MAINFSKLLKDLDIKAKLPKNDKTVDLQSNNTQKLSNLSGFEDELKKIDGQYNVDNMQDIDLPENSGTKPLEYQPLTDIDIEGLAKNSLADYINKSTKAIEQDLNSQKKDLSDYKQQLYDALSQKESVISDSYQLAKSSTAAEALKRGLARSSVALSQSSVLDEKRAEQIADVRNSYIEQAAEIDYQLSDLETKKQSALADLDISYAAKLAIEIDELKNERSKKIEEVTKYNNELAKYEAEYNINRQKAEQDLTLGQYEIMKNKTVGKTDIEQELSKQKQEKKFEYILDYLSGMSKKDAINFAENNDLIKNSLDTYYYRKLLNAIEARS